MGTTNKSKAPAPSQKRAKVEGTVTVHVDELPLEADRATIEAHVDHQLTPLREEMVLKVVEQLDIRRHIAAKKAAE